MNRTPLHSMAGMALAGCVLVMTAGGCESDGSEPLAANRPPQVRPVEREATTATSGKRSASVAAGSDEKVASGKQASASAKSDAKGAPAASNKPASDNKKPGDRVAARPGDASRSEPLPPPERRRATSDKPPPTPETQSKKGGEDFSKPPSKPPAAASGKQTVPTLKGQSAPAAAGATTGSPGSRATAPIVSPDPSLPPFKAIVNEQNNRAKRLSRVWARAVASIEFTDREGKQRWEQGEGHFQVIQPSKLALSVGKLGDVFLWIGCDDERYWFIDPKETKRAYVGRHDLVTRDKIDKLGLPVPPRDLIALAGITPIPGGSERAVRRVDGSAEGDAGSIQFDQPRGAAVWRTRVDSSTLAPVGIEIFESGSAEAAVSASLRGYQPVKIRAEGGFAPKIASRIEMVHHATASQMNLSLSDVSDGGKSRLKPEAFDFEALVELLGVHEVVDLDEDE